MKMEMGRKKIKIQPGGLQRNEMVKGRPRLPEMNDAERGLQPTEVDSV